MFWHFHHLCQIPVFVFVQLSVERGGGERGGRKVKGEGEEGEEGEGEGSSSNSSIIEPKVKMSKLISGKCLASTRYSLCD